MINPENAWPLIRDNALKALKVKMIWHSLVKDRTYQLKSVLQNSIEIIRTDGGENEFLTSSRVRKAAVDFNNAECKVQRRHLISPTVAEETAFVLFHPELKWDDNNEYIIEI